MSKGHCSRLNRRNHLREDEMPYVENSIAFSIQGNEENFFLLPFGFSSQKFEVKNGVQFQVPLFFSGKLQNHVFCVQNKRSEQRK